MTSSGLKLGWRVEAAGSCRFRDLPGLRAKVGALNIFEMGFGVGYMIGNS